MAYEVALGWSRRVRASCASCFSPPTAAGVLGIPFFVDVAVFLLGELEDVLAGGFFARFACDCACAGNATAIASNMKAIELRRLEGVAIKMAREWELAHFAVAVLALVAQDRRGVRICTKRFRIASGQDFNHPVIKIIDGMRLYGMKQAIVFFVSLFNVITQSYAQILVLTPGPHIFGAQQLNILHVNLGYAIGASVQFLLIRGQRSQSKNRIWFRRCHFDRVLR